MTSPPEMNECVLKADYAVRGELVKRAVQIQKEISSGEKSYPFDKVVLCNIGNPKALGQPNITFFRQVLAACHYPPLCEDTEHNTLPKEARVRARALVDSCEGHNIGAYSTSQGLESVRHDVANFLLERDGVSTTLDRIFLSDGASPAIKSALQLFISNPKVGVMIPIPQYPLYSASVTLYGGSIVSYLLRETENWALEEEDLVAATTQAAKDGVDVRILVIINPGNPTGQCLTAENIKTVINFAKAHNLIILADEVYQTNIYNEATPFVSFRRVLHEMGPEYNSSVKLISFHSTSKGFLGECGYRGGFMELTNFDSAVLDQFYKLASICLCPNLSGQIMTSLMVNPPRSDDACYPQYKEEVTNILDSLKRRAEKTTEILNSVDGIVCQRVEGAMYAFPRIEIPPKAIEAAASVHKRPDVFFALELLEATGVCTVPGSGFGKEDGWFVRTTILPPEHELESVLHKFVEFYVEFKAKYN